MSLLAVLLLMLSACAPHDTGLIVIEDYPCVTNTGLVYYVDAAAGDDSQDGRSPASAWQTVSRVNSYHFQPGDVILFKSGQYWRERIIPQSGTRTGWLYYGSYGSGARPLLIGSVERNSPSHWTEVGSGLWECTTPFSEDIGNIIFDNAAAVGYKKFTLGELTSQGDFFYHPLTGVLTLYSASHPTNVYSDIECALAQHMLYVPNTEYPHIGAAGISNVVIQGLAFTYGGGYALKFQSVHHIYVLDNEISWMGGGEVDGQPDVRYGNGVEFYDYAYHCKVIGNTIWEMYDSGVSVQGKENNTAAVNIEFRDNVIWNCGYASYELWYKSLPDSEDSQLKDILFNQNICSNAGGGWGAQRPGQGGFHILLDRTLAQTSGIQILSNTFHGAGSVMLAVNRDFNRYSGVAMDYNTWTSATNALLYYYFHTDPGYPVLITDFMLSEAAGYQTYTGWDVHSSFSY